MTPQQIADEALRLWQLARLSFRRGEIRQGRAYAAQCLTLLKESK